MCASQVFCLLDCVMTPNIIQRIRSDREQQLAEESRQERMRLDREDFEQMQREHEDWGKLHEIEQQKSEAPAVSVDEIPF